MLDDALWVEKYRPTALDAVALDDETRRVLAAYLEAGEIPHLLLVGPAGSGKTTIARIIERELDCRMLTLNASAERGIDIVRGKIGQFVRSLFPGARWNVVFLDEADAMTSDAQTALRNLIEAHTDRSRFILTGNKPHKIIDPIRSRCQVLTLGRPPIPERWRILKGILDAEGIEADTPTIMSYVERYPDLRQTIMTAQRAYLGSENGTLPPAKESGGTGGAEILAMIERGDWAAIRRLTASGDFDVEQGLRDLFWAVGDDHPKVGFLRLTIAEAVHESGFTPDPVVLFLGTCARVMEGP